MLEEYLEFAKKIALYAGKVMLDNYNNLSDLNYKEDKTVVTYVDKSINEYLINEVKKNFKTHSVIGEEKSYNNNSNYVWVCDPLDGTGMYVNHIPVFVFSLALVYDGEPIVGVVYNPVEDKMYTAMKDCGAYCNNKKIHVNNKDLGELGYRTNIEIFNNDIVDEVSLINDLKNISKISSIGSVARSSMAIAEGDFSCDIFPGTKHANCDIAASYIIVKESGGRITDIYGKEQRYDSDLKGAVITNSISHDKVLKKVKRHLL